LLLKTFKILNIIKYYKFILILLNYIIKNYYFNYYTLYIDYKFINI